MNVKKEIAKGVEYFIKHEQEMVSLYRFMYGETISICGLSCIHRYFEKIEADLKRPDCAYRMKCGKVLDTTMWDEKEIPKGHFTCKNITDQVAKKAIEKGYHSYFIL